MINKNAPQELGKELVKSSAVAGAVKREADAFKHGSFTWTVEKLKELVFKINSQIKENEETITTLKGKKMAFQELINAEYQVNSENSEDNLISQTTNKPIQF